MSEAGPLPGPAAPGGASTPVPDPSAPTAATAPPAAPEGRSASNALVAAGRGLLVPVLSVVTAFLLGAIVIILSDQKFVAQLGSDPLAALRAGLDSVSRAYSALFTGAIGSPTGYLDAFASGDTNRILTAFRPISETLLAATPLIFTGLAVALGFQSGLFNIGAEGQLYAGAVLATLVGFSLTGLPGIVHLALAIGAGFLGGALWGFIPGILKARTGAHEVIVTIMLNYIAYRLVDFLLKTPLFQRPGRSDSISKVIQPSAELPSIVEGLRVDWGFILALGVAVAVSWLLFRSTKGFEFRAVGLNPSAARYAGISIGAATVVAMMISGGLAGLAGTVVILGVTQSLTFGISPGYGFDGIALALMASSKPKGIILAALLFGALRAGATPMQSATGIPTDLVVVIQALVIMFVAAPALVRGIYRIRVSRTTGTEIFSKGWGS
ncbi:MAG: ral nucleoside transport system permease protein [Chloroflexota bacterium]|nr:ral nucleoside transport system permease protein [Chloroflexota bacterium]